ncbi:hypothetical protein PG984_015011 [Apiospora sp. TS-2023a]
MSQIESNLDPGAWSADMSRQAAYLLACMVQRLDDSEPRGPSQPARHPPLRTLLSYFLNDKSLPPPEAALELPEAPVPRFTDIPAGAPLDQIEELLIDDLTGLQAYRYYIMKPYRDKLIDSWDAYYPWLQIWRSKVDSVAIDAKARGLLGDASELMQRLKKRHPALADITKLKASYETGHGSEYFHFAGIGSQSIESENDADSSEFDFYEDASAIAQHQVMDIGGKFGSDGGPSKVDTLKNHDASDAIKVVDYLVRYNGVDPTLYRCINEVLGRVELPEAAEIGVTRLQEHRQLMKYSRMVDIEFDTTQASSRSITLAEALRWKKWVSRTSSGLFCFECPCPRTVCPVMTSDPSEETHDIHADHVPEVCIATHNLFVKLWYKQQLSEWATLSRLHTNSGEQDSPISRSSVTKSVSARSLLPKGAYFFRLPDGGQETFFIVCTHPDCNWVCSQHPFESGHAASHFLQDHGLRISDSHILEHFAFLVNDILREDSGGSQRRSQSMDSDSAITKSLFPASERRNKASSGLPSAARISVPDSFASSRRWSDVKLREECRRRHLSTDGNRMELKLRLKPVFAMEDAAKRGPGSAVKPVELQMRCTRCSINKLDCSYVLSKGKHSCKACLESNRKCTFRKIGKL